MKGILILKTKSSLDVIDLTPYYSISVFCNSDHNIIISIYSKDGKLVRNLRWKEENDKDLETLLEQITKVAMNKDKPMPFIKMERETL